MKNHLFYEIALIVLFRRHKKDLMSQHKSSDMKNVMKLFYVLICIAISKWSNRIQVAGHKVKNRIVAGRKLNLKATENQFLVAVAFHTEKCRVEADTLENGCSFSCTGSVISSKWIISAAHCLGPKTNLDARDPASRKEHHCISRSSGYTERIGGIYCKINQNGDLEILPKRVKSYIFVKVNNFEKDYKHLKHYEVRRLVSPRDSYRGGGYKV